MKITKSELIEMGACQPGLKRFIKQTKGTNDAVEVSSLIGGENTYSDFLWLAGKKLSKERIVRFACNCALINIEKIKPFTDKYDLIIDFLNNPTDAATCAAYDAYSAACDAYSAACDAHASDAAYSAYSAYAAAHAAAADYSADVAADAYIASRAGCLEKVDHLLRKLFE